MQTKNKGFTLIELMVATSLFVIIMLSAMSALFVLLGESKNSRALRLAMDNVNFAMESMTRSIRMGASYYCAGYSEFVTLREDAKECPDGGPLLTFLPQGAIDRIGYQKDNEGVLRRYDSGHLDGIPIVSPDVKIDTLKFFVKGSETTDIQPSVYIIIKGTVTVKKVSTSFSIQTLASQRKCAFSIFASDMPSQRSNCRRHVRYVAASSAECRSGMVTISTSGTPQRFMSINRISPSFFVFPASSSICRL